MLDAYLSLLVEQDKTASVRAEMVESMKRLPIDELRDIAEGRTKLAFDSDGDWLEKYKGTPLMEQALGLEKQLLEIEVKRRQVSMQRQEAFEQMDGQLDPLRQQESMLCLQKKMLDLELMKAMAGVSSAAEPTPEAPMGGPETAPAEAQGAPEAPGTKIDVKTASEKIREIVAKTYPDILLPQKKGKEKDADFEEKVAAMRMKLAAQPKKSGEQKLEDAYSQYDKAHTTQHGARELLSALGGGVAGGGAGAALGYGGSSLVNALAGKQVINPGTAAKAIGFPSAGVGALMGGLLGGSHGQNDVNLGKAHERVYKLENKYAGLSPEKVAFMGAVMQGLKGAGSFLGGAGRAAAGAAKSGGMGALGSTLKTQATQGIARAGQFAAQNPLAAGAIGAGALGTAALGGAAVG